MRSKMTAMRNAESVWLLEVLSDTFTLGAQGTEIEWEGPEEQLRTWVRSGHVAAQPKPKKPRKKKDTA